MAPEIATPFAVVCHDAGAANLVASWVAAEGLSRQVNAFVRGPAERIWREAVPDGATAASIEEALTGVRAVLTGTGWSSTIEHDARRAARAAGLPSVGVIDHWVNYAARFERDGVRVLPDEIWIADADAERIAGATFPELPVRRMRNFYLDAQVQAVGPVPSDGDVLYVLEPIRDAWPREAAGEFEALDFFMAHRAFAGVPEDVRVRLRLHPSEPTGKYDAWIARHAQRSQVTLDTASSLAAAMSGARWVAGCETMGLVLALAAGRVAIGTLPPWAPVSRLPQADIVELSRLVNQPAAEVRS